MHYIFLDESRDLGFDLDKAGTSKFFTITLLVCDAKAFTGFRSAVRRTMRGKLNALSPRHAKHELKGTDTSLAVKRYFLKQCPAEGWGLYATTVSKEHVPLGLQIPEGAPKLYDFLASLALDKVDFSVMDTSVNLIVDRCKNPKEIENFNRFIGQQIKARISPKARLTISHESSQESAGLQCVDMFCWGIARKYEGDGTEWYGAYKDWVKSDLIYFYTETDPEDPNFRITFDRNVKKSDKEPLPPDSFGS